MLNDSRSSSSSNRKKGAVLSSIYICVQIVINLLYVPMLLGTIGSNEYGLYQLVGSIVAYITSINSVLSAGVGRFYSMYKADEDAQSMGSVLVSARRMFKYVAICAVGVICIIIPVFNYAYRQSLGSWERAECSVMLAFLAINMVVTLYNTISIAILQANERFAFLKGSQLVFLVIQPLVVLLVATEVPYAFVITGVTLLSNSVCAFVQRRYCKRVLEINFGVGNYDRHLARSIAGFSLSVILVTIADQVFWSSDKMVVAYFFGSGLVAVYAIGAQIYSTYLYTGQIISGVFFQRVSELYHKQHDIAAISLLFAKVGRLTSMICFCVLLGFTLIGRDFVLLWAGNEYEQSFLIALIVMVPFTIDLIQNLGITILQVMNRYMFRGIVYIVMATIKIMLTVLVIDSCGLIGAAVCTALTMFVGNGIVMNIYYKRAIGLDIKHFWFEIARLVVPLIVFGVIACSVKWQLAPLLGSWPMLLVAAIIFVLGYCAVLYVFGMNSYEKGLVRKGIRSILHY